MMLARQRAHGGGLAQIGLGELGRRLRPAGPPHRCRQHDPRHAVIGALVGLDEKLGLKPELAESWSAIEPTIWEFKLRKDAKFHDGSPFTAEDVVFSAERVATVPNSPGRFTIYTRHIKRMEAVDPHTVRFHTERVYPLMPNQLAGLLVVSKRAAENASTADFNSGKAAIGTGPYRMKSYVPNASIELERNDAFYGNREPFQRVTFRLMTNAATRVAALKAGDVELIDVVPTEDAEALKREANLDVFSTPGVRNIYLYIDQKRDQTPGVFDAQGRVLDKNPLEDVRVRRALSMAINRDGIVRSVMSGQASASGQLLPAGVMGVDPDLKPDRFDVEAAKKLLAEAGYPSGFTVVLAGPSDRYINDAKILQAIAQSWTRAGITTRVDAQPSSVYFGKAARDEFSIGLLGWGTGTGEPDSPLQALIATNDQTRGWGTANRSGFSNARLDALLGQALSTLDRTARDQLYRQATRIAMEELAIIPLHHQVNVWATRKGFTYNARNDERTMVMELRPAR
ncbi:MAG: ABC transporter substrate-binding protein [Alphaproteobacteria bacterium]|nr:ABC transporter substrate-binding protein [Alphaproteobacteria bacterium]